MEALDADFHERRREGIGSTDSAAILGLSPWKSAFDVWRQKVEGAEPKEQTLPMWLGLKLEEAIAELYTAQESQPVEKDPIQYTLGPRHILRAHVDYRWSPMYAVAPIVECKTSRTKRGWGEAGTDKIPKHYWLQVQHQLICTGAGYADVAVLFGHDDFRVYRIERDEPFMEALIKDLEEWWDLYVVTKTPPPLDGSEGASIYLRGKYPTDTLEPLPATADHSSVVQELFTLREAQAALARSDELLVQRLKDAIGGHAGMIGPDFRIIWKGQKSSKHINYPAVLDSLSVWLRERGLDPDAVIGGLIAANTEIKAGRRPFILEFMEGANRD